MNANSPISFEATLKARYADARGRIFAAGIRAKANDNEPVRVVLDPEWMIAPTHFDAHVTDYQLYIAKFASPKRAFLIERAAARGFTISQIIETSRIHKVVIARQDVMLEVAEAFPHMTLNEIGRLFGGYDHSTVRSGLERAALRRAGLISKVVVTRVKRTPLNRTPDDIRQKVVELYRAGMNQTEIGKAVGISRPTVRTTLLESGDLHVGKRD